MSDLVQLEVLLRVGIAMLLGVAVGIEREHRGHPAGLRTMALVSVGSCLFAAAGLVPFPGHATDPTRIAAQVVTGVGFLGAGAIFRSHDSVRGLTTAATVWVVAAVGMATGFGLYILAVGGTAVTLVGLIGIRPLEARFFAGHRRSTDPPLPHHDQDEVL